jgi:hypothetical protein
VSGNIFRIAREVEFFIEEEGLTKDELVDMVRRSARASFKRANRRYHQYAFMVLGDQITLACRVADADVQEYMKEGEFLVYEPCTCQGRAGCTICGGAGEVPVIRQVQSTMESDRARKTSSSRN